MSSLKSMLKDSPLEYRRKKFVFRVIQFNEKVDQMANSSERLTFIRRLELEHEMRGEYSDIYMCDKLQRREKREGEQRKRDHFNKQRKKLEKEVNEDKELLQMFHVMISRVYSYSQALQRSKRRTSPQAYFAAKKNKIGDNSNNSKQMLISAGNLNEVEMKTENEESDMLGQPTNHQRTIIEVPVNQQIDGNSAQNVNLQEAINPD